MQQFWVAAELEGIRLDRFVAQATQVSRRQARLWIAAGQVFLGRQCAKILTRPLRAGARVRLAADAAVLPASPSAPELQVVHLDRYVVAFNKPPGLLSETDRRGSPSVETLAPELLRRHGERDGRLWLVHRLDAGTSGLLLMARTPMAAAALSAAFREGGIAKQYVALCQGVLAAGRRIDAPIGRIQGTRHGVRQDGKAAQTAVHVLQRGTTASLLQLRPATGRTHQLRVHLQHLGHPLQGDALYGGPRYVPSRGDQPACSIPRCMLHAQNLRLRHPKSGTPLALEVMPPGDFAAVQAALGM